MLLRRPTTTSPSTNAGRRLDSAEAVTAFFEEMKAERLGASGGS